MASSDKSDCKQKLQAVIKELEEIAESLDSINYNANVSSVVSNALSILGSVLTIGGMLASILTLGLATPVALSGLAAGGAGGIIGVVSAISEHFCSKSKLDAANALWESLMEDPVFGNYIKEVDGSECRQEMGIGVKISMHGHKVGDKAKTAYNIIKEARKANAPLLSGRVVFRVLTKKGAVVEAVLLPITIRELISTSIALGQKTNSHGGDQVRKLLAFLRLILKDLQN